MSSLKHCSQKQVIVFVQTKPRIYTRESILTPTPLELFFPFESIKYRTHTNSFFWTGLPLRSLEVPLHTPRIHLIKVQVLEICTIYGHPKIHYPATSPTTKLDDITVERDPRRQFRPNTTSIYPLTHDTRLVIFSFDSNSLQCNTAPTHHLTQTIKHVHTHTRTHRGYSTSDLIHRTPSA